MAKGKCLFKRAHHVRIATVLQALDAETLTRLGCLFGGGTAIVMSRGEYRESLDMDFLISNLTGYRELRDIIKKNNNLSAIVRKGMQLNLSREIRADQYGIRTMIKQGENEIKFEIVFEGRISLEFPNSYKHICGVSTLTPLDMATSKLLANSDRWADDAVFSRDLIDLAMLNLSSVMLHQSVEKAALAYGKSILRDLKKAISSLKNRPGRLSACMSALKMDIPEAVLWQKIRKLSRF